MVAQVLSLVLTNKSFQRLTVQALEVLAKRTDNTIDDHLVAIVKAKLSPEAR